MKRLPQTLQFSVALVVFCLSPVISVAQVLKQNDATSPTPATLELGAPTGGSLAAPPATIDGLQPIPDPARSSKQAGEQNIIVTASEATRLSELEAKVRRLEQLIEAQSSTLQDIADKIGSPAEELRAIREELVKLGSGGSKQVVGRAELGGEAPSLASIGKLVVTNYTGVPYTMAVNGQQFVFGPGRGELNVQFGPVTTEILGYEAPKLWAEADWRSVQGERQLAIQIQ